MGATARAATITRRALVGLVAALVVASAQAERVVRVKDGDSIIVRSADNEVDVRIADIDAPELDQPHGAQAKAALERLVEGREVRLQLVGGDAYRRIVADVFVDGRDVAAVMVRGGHAWVRRAFTSAAGLIGLEEAAHAERRGLWADAQPIAPWIWRKRSGRPDSRGMPRTAPRISVECGTKQQCREMRSCEEAIAYLHECGVETIDGDGDGIPCESLCRYYR